MYAPFFVGMRQIRLIETLTPNTQMSKEATPQSNDIDSGCYASHQHRLLNDTSPNA
jgi:hypothetical protein